MKFDCAKCNGAGHIRGFSHYAAGVCFDCGGAGRFDCDPLSPSAAARAAINAAHDKGVRALAVAVGLCADGRTYTTLGSMIVGAHSDRGNFCGPVEHLNPAHRRRVEAGLAFWDEVCTIVDAAVLARSIRPSALARLQAMADEWSAAIDRNLAA